MIPASQIPPTLPQHIREQDKLIWRNWMDTRRVSDINSKRTYVRHLRGFYEYTEEPIRETDTVGIDNYEQHLLERGFSPVTVRGTINTIKSYWRYAREQEASRL